MSVHTSLRTLDLVLSKAFEEQLGRRLGTRKPRESDEELLVWTLAEARRFGEHVGEDRQYPTWRLLLVSGLRCGLRCGDLGPNQGTPTVRRQIVVKNPGSRTREKPPKSHNGLRTLVLDAVTLGMLAGMASAATSQYLFTGRTGQPMRPDNLTDRFNQLAVAAKVRPLGPHQIRHMFTSNLLDTGECIHEVAERLGHDPATLVRYYARVGATRRRQASDRIAELVTPPERRVPRTDSAHLRPRRGHPLRSAVKLTR